MLAVARAGPSVLLTLVFFLSPDIETQCLVPLGPSSGGAGAPRDLPLLQSVSSA